MSSLLSKHRLCRYFINYLQYAKIATIILGIPQKMTDSSGTVEWSSDYKRFDEATVLSNTVRVYTHVRSPKLLAHNEQVDQNRPL